jgi:hypothetical protein
MQKPEDRRPVGIRTYRWEDLEVDFNEILCENVTLSWLSLAQDLANPWVP